MIRETITIGLLMFASSTFGQICTQDCDPAQVPVTYVIENAGTFATTRAAVEGWLKATYCTPPEGQVLGRHQALYGPSGNCSAGQIALFDFSKYVVFGQCPATNAAVPDTDGFGLMSKSLIRPDLNVVASDPDTPQPKIAQTSDRAAEVQLPSGVKRLYRETGGAWLSNRSNNRLTKLPDGWALDVEDGSVEKYDAKGTLVSSTDKDGNVTWFTFDERGLEIQRVTNGLVTTTKWHLTFKVPIAKAEPKKITTYLYGDETTNPDPAWRGRTVRKSTQETGDLTGELAFDAPKVGPLTIETTTTYIETGQVKQLIDIKGSTMLTFGYAEPEAAPDGTALPAARELIEIGVFNYKVGSLNYMRPIKFYNTRSPRPPVPPVGLCGSGWSEPLVPDGAAGALRTLDFSRACIAHDACYGICGKSKDQCDQEIQVSILEECTAYKDSPGLHQACENWANAYRIAVQTFGAKPYADAQQNCSATGRCLP